MNNKNVAVVLGMTETGLGTIRSLGRSGVRVIGLDYHKDIGFYSRYAESFLCPHPLKESDCFLQFMISLAKKLEEIFIVNSKNSIILPKNSSALRLLIAIRDESHRFAITFHKKRRKKRTITTKLEKIKGIGEETKILLLKNFGSIENIKNQSPQKLSELKGIGLKTAEKILKGLNDEK